jgi:hypothetical protein
MNIFFASKFSSEDEVDIGFNINTMPVQKGRALSIRMNIVEALQTDRFFDALVRPANNLFSVNTGKAVVSGEQMIFCLFYLLFIICNFFFMKRPDII